MAIEKMALVNLSGSLSSLDTVLEHCLASGVFHPEQPQAEHQTKGFSALNEENLYAKQLKRVQEIAESLSVPLTETEPEKTGWDLEKITDYMAELETQIAKLTERKKELQNSVAQHKKGLKQIDHLIELHVNFDDLFACKHIKIRFGQLSVESAKKLDYYDHAAFFFFPLSREGDIYWCVYFTPENQCAQVDDIFNSLYFHRIRVPEYAHGTPEVSIQMIHDMLEKEQKELEEIETQLSQLQAQNTQKICQMFCWLQYRSDIFALRKYASVLNKKYFFLSGFVPQKEAEAFSDSFKSMSEKILCWLQPCDIDERMKPPVKLKNTWFFRPFEMFVNMYGTPSYGDFDPTFLVGLTYTLLFGIMFGDLGQGLCLIIVGCLMWRWKKIALGKVLTRVGISSAFFGTVYGSVFGFEHLLDPLYKNVFGLSQKPIEVFEQTNFLLVAAVGIGAVIIAVSIGCNIYLGFKRKDLGRALFSNNGLAGLILYLFVLIGAVMMLTGKGNLFTLPFILLFVVLPLLAMFLREPLGRLVAGQRGFKPEGGIVSFIVENFFEFFEFVLSYVTNTMSFLRVGGFVLSHAGMMMVVMSMSEMFSGGASIAVIIFGNIFVMAMEGLLVGIQVLRLEFYEIFSRFFDGGGEPFEPVKVSYQINSTK